MTAPGTLFLIPTALSAPIEVQWLLPAQVIAVTKELNHYIAENAKTARAFLKAAGVEKPLASISIIEINKHAATSSGSGVEANQLDALLAPLLAGQNVGLVSEAGAPAVADPGAQVVAAAHQQGIPVCPLVGPSALLLGLMASGLDGQRFAFHGYLPQDKAIRRQTLVELERESRQRRMTQLFIETPYRNAAMLADLQEVLNPATRLCIATDLTGAKQTIRTLPIGQWRKRTDAIDKLPTLFLFCAKPN